MCLSVALTLSLHGRRRNLRSPTSELNWYDIKTTNHFVSFLCLSFSLPFEAANKLLSGLTHRKRLGLSFHLSISTREGLNKRRA